MMSTHRSFLLLVVVSLFALGLTGRPSEGTLPDYALPGIKAILGDGEELVYEVSWTFVKLGTIRLKAYPNGTMEAHIDSYPNLPFVDLHSVHYSTVDTSFYSLSSRSLEKKEKGWWGLDYKYDFKGKRLTIEETYRQNPGAQPYSSRMKDTINMPTMSFVDGLCIGYFPRRFIHTAQTVSVPTVLYAKLGTTTFRFTNNQTTESIDAVEDPVKVIQVEGTTDVEGIYGMTGDFTGWFSDDAAGVPIKGKLKVLIGNVTLELKQWNKKGWNPPH